STGSGALAVGTNSDSVSLGLSKLAASTTYHYRLVATNADGTTYGADRTFKTSATSASKLTVRITGIASTYRIGSVAAHGLSFKVACGKACSVRASLLVSAKLAKALGIGRRQSTIATGSGSIRKAGTVKLTLRFTSKARKPVGR